MTWEDKFSATFNHPLLIQPKIRTLKASLPPQLLTWPILCFLDNVHDLFADRSQGSRLSPSTASLPRWAQHDWSLGFFMGLSLTSKRVQMSNMFVFKSRMNSWHWVRCFWNTAINVSNNINFYCWAYLCIKRTKHVTNGEKMTEIIFKGVLES